MERIVKRLPSILNRDPGVRPRPVLEFDEGNEFISSLV